MFEHSSYKTARVLLHIGQVVAALLIMDAIAYQFGYAVVVRTPSDDVMAAYWPTLAGLALAFVLWAMVQMQLALLDLADSNRLILEEMRRMPEGQIADKIEPVFDQPEDAPLRGHR
ncbi:hypothetical protein [Pontivivens insulae]|uniref:Uncharacterized protein n=1 Tax=Pontivivens insulae TaxID=1639689 RepID=A0A2R8ABS6_9RHOB|nr:hypothetical protein [Pontivivens insulae]RED11144.1 hypothetical protein DFR53_3174 [Pontivivens insulae]SPF29682.1 hypothetical protein POI8812_01998 [Pontivivens insulae]